MDYIAIPKALRVKGINGYSDSAAQTKAAFHNAAKVFLRTLAKAIGLEHGCDFRLTSNLSGMAGSGEVTLHADKLYVQLSEWCTEPGVKMLYRTCKGRTDYSGGQNNSVSLTEFAEEDAQQRILQAMQAMVGKTQNAPAMA